MRRSREFRYSNGSKKIFSELPKSTSNGRRCLTGQPENGKEMRKPSVKNNKTRKTARVMIQEPLKKPVKRWRVQRKRKEKKWRKKKEEGEEKM